jgi:hypothetical protein
VFAQVERQVVMGQWACEHFCQKVKREAGVCPKQKAGVRWRLLCNTKTAASTDLHCSRVLKPLVKPIEGDGS